MRRHLFFDVNGHTTTLGDVFAHDAVKKKIAYAKAASTHWSSTEYSSVNAAYMNFTSGNLNNNNKANSYVARPVSALTEEEKMEWIEALDDCCRHKRKSDGCVRYLLCHERDLWELASSVKDGTYTPSTSICFCVTRPKLREVFAANFRDRVVHHWLIMKLNNLIEEEFCRVGDVSYNCRKGYGTLSAVYMLKKHIYDVSANYTDNNCWVGRFDFVGFFMSIDKEYLYGLLCAFINEKYTGGDKDTILSVISTVVKHNPASNCEKRGDTSLFECLPDNKTLFRTGDGKGLPIGNLTSQIFANFYLSGFDEAMVKFCAERGGRYIRFVDDFTVVMKSSKDVMSAYRYALELAAGLRLTVHKDKVYIQHYTKGVRFIGYVIKKDRIYLTNKTYGGMENRMREAESIANTIGENEIGMESAVRLAGIIRGINSYVGFSAHTNGYRKRMKVLLKYRKIYRFVYLKGKYCVMKIKYKYDYRTLLTKISHEKHITNKAAGVCHQAQGRTDSADIVFQRERG